jgi:hypothetical protein
MKKQLVKKTEDITIIYGDQEFEIIFLRTWTISFHFAIPGPPPPRTVYPVPRGLAIGPEPG